jgi:hypothetical protein
MVDSICGKNQMLDSEYNYVLMVNSVTSADVFDALTKSKEMK